MQTYLISVPLFGAPGPWEWVLIGLAIFIFFGAAKLPQLGKGLGEGIRNFKKGLKGELDGEKTPKLESDNPANQKDSPNSKDS